MIRKIASLATALLCLASSLAAFPQGFQLVDGIASPPTIDPNNWFIVQSDGRAIIDWQSFSIANGEYVYFAQSGDHAAILNRVTGSQASQLQGLLKSNGSIYLINENGIFMGSNSDIETAGFVAATFDTDNQAFMDNGPLHFQGTSTQSLINRGFIYCQTGDILLASHDAQSTGRMLAPNGTINIISGDPQITIYQLHGAKHLFLRGLAAATPVEATTTVVEGNQVYLK